MSGTDKITGLIALVALVVGITSIDSDSMVPIFLVIAGMGWLMVVLVKNWDAIVRFNPDDVEELLRKERRR